MALDLKRDMPVRLPNPSAQPFVAALKTARLFAVVFFWITMVSVLAYVFTFVLTEWICLYDDPVTSTPAATSTGVQPPTTQVRPDWWSGLEGTAKASGDVSFFGLKGKGGKSGATDTEPDTSTNPATPSSAVTTTTTAASAPSTVRAGEDVGKIEGKPEMPLPERTPVNLEEQQRKRAENARHVTQNILKPLRVVGVMFGSLLAVALFLYLQIALLGRLSGIRQLTNALFLLLLFLAAVVPWDSVFNDIHVNAFYNFEQLLRAHGELHTKGMDFWKEVQYYLQFLGLPLASALILAWSGIQFASGHNESVVANE